MDGGRQKEDSHFVHHVVRLWRVCFPKTRDLTNIDFSRHSDFLIDSLISLLNQLLVFILLEPAKHCYQNGVRTGDAHRCKQRSSMRTRHEVSPGSCLPPSMLPMMLP